MRPCHTPAPFTGIHHPLMSLSCPECGLLSWALPQVLTTVGGGRSWRQSGSAFMNSNCMCGPCQRSQQLLEVATLS